MNLKNHYKKLLSEEIKKSTPREAALIRQNLGLPPASTKEQLGGTEHQLPMGSDWNVLSRRFIKRALEVGDKEGRELFKSVPVANRTGRAAATSFTGIRNLLLHGTGQNPDELGSFDAVSPPRIFQRRSEMTPAERKRDAEMSGDTPGGHMAFQHARSVVKHLFDVDLRPEHVDGLDHRDANFVRDVINRVNYNPAIRFSQTNVQPSRSPFLGFWDNEENAIRSIPPRR